MSTHRNRPDSWHQASQMNARRREKQRQLTEARKPQKDAQWIALIDDMNAWYKANEWALDIDDYAVAKGYVPYKIYRDWPNEVELFKEHISSLYAMLKQRHNNIMMQEGKMSQLIMKERPLYNPRLAEYEQSLRKQDETQQPSNMTVYYKEIPRTPALDVHEREKNEKNSLE